MLYKVEWSDAAIEDLLVEVRTRRVSTELLRVAETALDDYWPPDGGTERNHLSVYWRRGLTTKQRAEYDANGTDLDAPGVEEAYNFAYVYRRLGAMGNGWFIIALVRMEQLCP